MGTSAPQPGDKAQLVTMNQDLLAKFTMLTQQITASSATQDLQEDTFEQNLAKLQEEGSGV